MLKDMTTLELAARLIRAATGQDYGDGDVVTDMGEGYTDGRDGVWVTGNWNRRGGWYCPNSRGSVCLRKGSCPTHRPTKADTMPERLGDALEFIGVECEWSDENHECAECHRLARTAPDSYSWTLDGSWTSDGFVCGDCMRSDVGAYLDDYVDNSDNAVTWCDAKDLTAIGFVQWAPGDEETYENGWHPGQTDEPPTIMAGIHADYPNAEVVFYIDSVGQFDIHFEAYVRFAEDEPFIDAEDVA